MSQAGRRPHFSIGDGLRHGAPRSQRHRRSAAEQFADHRRTHRDRLATRRQALMIEGPGHVAHEQDQGEQAPQLDGLSRGCRSTPAGVIRFHRAGHDHITSRIRLRR